MAGGYNDINIDIDELSGLLGDMFGNDSNGKPIDFMHDETTKEIERTRKRLAAEYKQAQKELERSANQYFKKFEKEDKRRARLVAQGKIKESDYKNWRKNRILYHKGMQAQVSSMAEYLSNVGQQAADIVNGKLPAVYAGNYNYARYEIEKGLKIDTAFTLFDEHSVNRLAHKNPRLLPKVHPDKIKGEKWSKRKINNVISQGILQGKPLTEVAHGLEDVCRMEWSSAYRNARTAMTGAQNGGRFDSYKEAEQMGINLQKQWLATLDGHTRKSHRALDGESVPIKETFSNDLMYPADPDGHPAEVYNCRCTMIADLADYQDESFMRWDNIDGVPIEYCTYTEWEAARKAKSGAAKATTAAVNKPQKHTKEFKELKETVKNKNIEYVPVGKTKGVLSDSEIIDKLAGGDMTKGSCASLSFSYIANKKGLNVTDFRGGASQEVFSKVSSIEKMLKVANADIMKYEVEREAKEAAKILLGLEKHALYYFDAGEHAAIVKTGTSGVEYLEMQSALSNGWKSFGADAKAMENTLWRRFGCRKRIDKQKLWSGKSVIHKKEVRVVPLSSIEATPEFQEMMGYINTATDKQKKGLLGGEK